MNKQEQTMLKHMNQIKTNIEEVDRYLSHIEGASKHLMTAKFEILYVMDLISRKNDGQTEIV